ncbi:MAG TPA: hypothetical protein VGK23_09605 [Methanomassiliicoccales archaeon]
MELDVLFIGLVTITTSITGILAGAGMDQVIKQLPARKRIGAMAYSNYFKAADLANGRYWYGSIGILSYLLALIAAIGGYLQAEGSFTMALLLLAAGAAIVHAFGTSRAAPTAFRVREAEMDERTISGLLDRFAKWTAVRGAAGIVMFVALILALVSAS